MSGRHPGLLIGEAGLSLVARCMDVRRHVDSVLESKPARDVVRSGETLAVGFAIDLIEDRNGHAN